MEDFKWDAKNPHVPVDESGNWWNYTARFSKAKKQYVTPFEATLQIDSITYGRSSRTINVVNADTGVKYPMFLSDFFEFVKNNNIIDGELKGTWTVIKRGANYGIVQA